MIAELGVDVARKLPAEAAHSVTIKALKAGLGVPLNTPDDPPALGVTLKRSGLNLSNPIGLAAGFDKNADVFAAMLKFGFGFVECGTVTPKPQPGNPRPRVFRLPEDRGVINRLGFNNHGLDYFVRRLKHETVRRGPVGANVGANKANMEANTPGPDYIAGMNAVWRYADYLTLNISSPNTPGLRGLQDGDALIRLLDQCGTAAKTLDRDYGFRPVFLKVAPDLDEEAIKQIAATALNAPYLHGLIVSNTTIARPDTLNGKHKGQAGGLSGAPLMDKSTEVLKAFSGEIGDKLDLIGVGGISSGADVHAKLKAGAQAVQLYSALVYEGPGLVQRLKDELEPLLAPAT
ncbi:MAG: quinone-dependent dihydroorotate dehydrogenase [Pseudomonadota bacterium]